MKGSKIANSSPPYLAGLSDSLKCSFIMEATKKGEDSSLQKLIKLVESANPENAKIVRVADKWATLIVVIAFICAVLTLIFTGEIIRAVTVLVVFCPCALILATPTAIMASIGNLTKVGILVKEGISIEKLAKIDQMIFDKTMVQGYNTSQFYLSNARHIECVNNAKIALDTAINNFTNTSLDFVVADIHTCWQSLGEVSGVNSNERIIDRIFEKFCLGK